MQVIKAIKMTTSSNANTAATRLIRVMLERVRIARMRSILSASSYQ
jgi:hypothetical protein